MPLINTLIELALYSAIIQNQQSFLVKFYSILHIQSTGGG